MVPRTYQVYWDERDYESSVDTDSLVGYWKLSANKLDSSGHGHTLTTAGAPTHNSLTCLRDLRVGRTDGVSNADLTSANFAAGNDWLAAASHADFNATTAVTVVASFTSGFAYTNRPIAAKTGVWVLKHDASQKLYFEVTTSGGTKRVTNPTATTLSFNHHAVGTYDAATGIVALYLDGVQVAVDTHTGNLVTNGNDVWVGHHSTNVWFGRLSHIKVYKDRAFSPRAARASYEAALLQIRNPITGYNINATDGLGIHIYWLIGGGVVVGNRLVILAADIRSATSTGQGWMGFTCTDFSGTPDTWTWEECDMPAYATAQPTYPNPTVSSVTDGRYYYATARNPDDATNWQLCRWALADVADADLSGAEWWDGATWQSDPLDAADLFPDTDAGGGGWLWKERDGTWVALHQVNEGAFVRTRGAIRTAPAITGPWSAHEVVATPPGFNASDNTKRWYAWSAHPDVNVPGGRGVFVTNFAGGDTAGDPNWVEDHPDLGWYQSGIIRGLPDNPVYEPWSDADDLLVQVNDDDTYPTRYLGVGDAGDTVDLGDGRRLWLIGDNLVSGNDANRNRSTSVAGLRNALGLWTESAYGTPPANRETWLAATIETHDGRSITFGPNASDEHLPTAMSFETQLPGGFGQASLTVPRPEGFSVLDAPLLASARFYGPGNRTVYEGRVAAKPHVGSDDITIELQGMSAHLDDQMFRQLYVSRDLSKWGAPSVQRRLDLLSVDAPHQGDAQAIIDDTGGPALRLAVTGEWDGTDIVPRCEAWFDAGSGLLIAYVTAEFDGWPDDDWQLFAFSADDDFTPIPGTDHYTDPSGTGTILYVPDTPHRWVGLNWVYGLTSNPSGRDQFEYGVNVRNLAVYGDHGLSLYDSEDGGAQGLLGSDIITHAVQLGAPMLDIDYVEPSTFAIPNLVFDGWDQHVRSVIEAVTLLGGAQDAGELVRVNDWGVYENGFFWRAPGSYGTTHRIRFDEGVTSLSEGEDAAEIANAIVASYTDATGTQKAVGYPGSGADTESALLVDTDPANPVNLSGFPSKVIHRDVGRTSDLGAINLARLALLEAIQTTRTGAYSIPSISGEAPYYLRAGDRVFVEDGYAREQPVITTHYDHGEGSVQADVGVARTALDIYLAQLFQLSGG